MQPQKKNNITQLLQNCIGPTIRIGREIQCLPYAGFFILKTQDTNYLSQLVLVSFWSINKAN